MVVAFRQKACSTGSSRSLAAAGAALLTLGLSAVAVTGVASADGPAPVVPNPVPTVAPPTLPGSGTSDPSCVHPPYRVTFASNGAVIGDTTEINITFFGDFSNPTTRNLWNPNSQPGGPVYHICYAEFDRGGSVIYTSTDPNGGRYTDSTGQLNGYITAADGAPATATPTPTPTPSDSTSPTPTPSASPTTDSPTPAPTTAAPISSTPVVITTTSAPALGGGSGTGGTIAPTAAPTTTTPAVTKLQFRLSWTTKTKALKGIKTVSWQLRGANRKTIIKKGTLKNGQTYTWNGAKPGTYTLWIIKTTGTGKHTKTVILKKVEVTIKAGQADNVRVGL